MRRMITTVILTTLFLVAISGYLVVTTVATALAGAFVGALAEIGSAITTIMAILTVPALVALAWVLSAADWPTWIEILSQVLKLLGWQ
jgi:hypothetical protein